MAFAPGARVVLSDIDERTLAATMTSLAHPRAFSCVADVASAASVAALAAHAAHAERHAGPVDGWVNNAGLARHRPIVEYTEADIDLMLAVNLKGAILGSQAALRAMLPRKRGLIINIASSGSIPGRSRTLVDHTARADGAARGGNHRRVRHWAYWQTHLADTRRYAY